MVQDEFWTHDRETFMDVPFGWGVGFISTLTSAISYQVAGPATAKTQHPHKIGIKCASDDAFESLHLRHCFGLLDDPIASRLWTNLRRSDVPDQNVW